MFHTKCNILCLSMIVCSLPCNLWAQDVQVVSEGKIFQSIKAYKNYQAEEVVQDVKKEAAVENTNVAENISVPSSEPLAGSLSLTDVDLSKMKTIEIKSAVKSVPIHSAASAAVDEAVLDLSRMKVIDVSNTSVSTVKDQSGLSDDVLYKQSINQKIDSLVNDYSNLKSESLKSQVIVSPAEASVRMNMESQDSIKQHD